MIKVTTSYIWLTTMFNEKVLQTVQFTFIHLMMTGLLAEFWD
jgi:hypothetical protein